MLCGNAGMHMQRLTFLASMRAAAATSSLAWPAACAAGVQLVLVLWLQLTAALLA